MLLYHNSMMHVTHTRETPEASGSGEQRTLQCRGLQNLFFIKPRLARGDIADFPNTEADTDNLTK